MNGSCGAPKPQGAPLATQGNRQCYEKCAVINSKKFPVDILIAK